MLNLTKWLGIDQIHIFGEAKGIIECAKGINVFNPPILKNCICYIKTLVRTIERVNFDYLYREHN